MLCVTGGCLLFPFHIVVFVQSLSYVQLFATPWTSGRQVSLSFTNSRSLIKLNSIESVVPSNNLFLCRPLLLLPLIFPGIRVFPNESTRIGASALLPPMNSRAWFPLGLSGLISLLSRRLSRVLSSTTVWKYQVFGAQLSLWSNSHIHTWLLEKP